MTVLAVLLLALAQTVASPVWATSAFAWTLTDKSVTLAQASSATFRLYLDHEIPELPPATALIDDAGATWTLKAGQILRNGVEPPPGGGRGSRLLYVAGQMYALGTDNGWWVYSGTWVQIPAKPVGRTLTGVTCKVVPAGIDCQAAVTGVPPGTHAAAITIAIGAVESPKSPALAIVVTTPTGLGVR